MLLALLAMIAAASAHAPNVTDAADRSASVLATVGESEWCPSGSARVDLETGSYLLTLRAARAICQVPKATKPVRRGLLVHSDLERVRSAAHRFRIEGGKNPACIAGRTPDFLVISNGGRSQVVLKTDQDFVWAPDDLTCWSDAASALHDVMADVFKPDGWR